MLYQILFHQSLMWSHHIQAIWWPTSNRVSCPPSIPSVLIRKCCHTVPVQSMLTCIATNISFVIIHADKYCIKRIIVINGPFIPQRAFVSWSGCIKIK